MQLVLTFVPQLSSFSIHYNPYRIVLRLGDFPVLSRDLSIQASRSQPNGDPPSRLAELDPEPCSQVPSALLPARQGSLG